MKISKTSIYAIRLIVNLAKQKSGELFMAEELAGSENIPKHYAAKILQRLAKYNFVESYKGRGGGFKLTNKSWNLSLFEVIELLDGTLKLDHCFFEFLGCSISDPCAFCKEWNIISNQYMILLVNFRISDLANGKSPDIILKEISDSKLFARSLL